MSTFTIELPSSISVKFRDEVGTREIDLAAKSREWLTWAIDFGIRQSVGDAISGKVGTSEGEAAILAKFHRVCELGEIPRQGSGGASGYSLEDRIASKFLTLSKVKGKLEDLDARWLEFAKPVILKSVDPDERKRLMSAPKELEDLANEYLETVIEAAKQEPLWAKAEEEVTKPKTKKEAPQLKITMKPKGK